MVPRGVPIRDWTLRNFTLQMRQALAEQFIAEASEDVRRSCMAMYDDFGGFRDLGNAGWAIANHTARHYPVSAVGQLSLLGPEFTECDECLRDRIGVESPYWVLPFDQSPDPGLDDAFDRMNERGRLVLVHVGNRANVGTNRADRLWRVSVPPVRGRELLRYLASIH
jgi:peptidoglycan/xylan/chitin deacetylase (PgdA/CDA1 family)